MKDPVSSQLKKLRREFQETLKSLEDLVGSEIVEQDWIQEEASFLIPFSDFFRWKARLIKEAFKGEDLAEKVELDPHKCSLGRFLDRFSPPDERAQRYYEELNRLHLKLHRKAQELRDCLQERHQDRAQIRAFLKDELFPLFQKIQDLLWDLSEHLEKRDRGQVIWRL